MQLSVSIFFLTILAFPLTSHSQVTPFWQQGHRIEQQEFKYSETNHIFLFQDDRGLLWGNGEENKLVWFDGNYFKYFENDKNDTTTFSGKIWGSDTKMLQDETGKIWIKGPRSLSHLDRYDPVFNRFDNIYKRLEANVDSPNTGIGDICEDRKGNIWIRSQPYLFKFDIETEEITSFKTPAWGGKLVFEDPFGNIWITAEEEEHSHYALYQLDASSGKFINRRELKFVKYYPVGRTRKDFCVRLDDGKTMLLLVAGHLYLFDAEQLTVAPLPNSLLENRLGSTLFKSDSLILVGSWFCSIYQFDQNELTFNKIFEDPSCKEDQNFSLILNIFQSKEGIIWWNSYETHKMFPSKRYFKTITGPQNAKFPQYAETMFVQQGEAVFDLEPGLEGVRKKELKLSGFDRSIPNISNYHDVVRQFIEGKNGELWMASTWQAGKKHMLFVRHFNSDGVTIKDYSFQIWQNGYTQLPPPNLPVRDLRFNRDKLKIAEIDPSGNLWLGTRKMIFRFDPKSEEIEIVQHVNDSTLVVGFKTIFIDRSNQIWFDGKKSGTAVKLDQITGEYELFSFNGKNEAANPGAIWCIYEDSLGRMWFGGHDGGVVRLDKDHKNFKLYSIDDGLQDGWIRKIFEDHRNNLWITTWYGKLNVYFPPEDRFIGLNVNDGIDNIHSWNARTYQDSENYIYLAGNNYQLFYFHPDSIHIDSVVSRVVLTDFYLANELVKVADSTGVLLKTLDYSDEIVLDYQQNDFSIHYTLPEFINPRELKFAYMLEPYHKNWQQVDKTREANFTNLDPGNYIFKVKAQNHHGFWGEVRSLKLTILPPWYRTWWASTIWIALVLGSIYGIYRFQLNRRLTEAESRRLRELDQAKSVLYTNITHEFRTPLTIILGMADQIKTDPQNWFSEGLQLIRRNGKQLLHLVNQLLDLSKLESGHMTLKLTHGDVVKYLQYLTESFHSYAESKDIRLHFASEMKSLEMDYDEEKLQNTFSNLVSNAIKFTQAGGDVYIQLSLVKGSAQSDGSHLLLVVKDNGPGIANDQLAHIFDRFYQVDNTHTRRGEGTGIGLALTKELVQLMGGNIEAESALDWGTKFTISLPLSTSFKSEMASPHLSSISDQIDSEFKEEQQLSEVPQGDLPMVLLIEDNRDVITYLSSFLSNEYVIRIANNGKQGVEKAIQLTPDLVVSDVMMPEMDGFEVCEILKKDERTSHIPIILLTAKSDSKARLEGLSHGADAYLPKPFNREELLIRIEKLIELRRNLQTHYKKTSELLKVAKKPKPTAEEIFLQKLIRIVEANYSDEHFGSPELCRKAGLSRSQLFRKLKAITGRSITNFIRSIRLAKGKELLEKTDKTVSEVAYETGFNSLNYFSKMFKEEFGISPSDIGKNGN